MQLPARFRRFHHTPAWNGWLAAAGLICCATLAHAQAVPDTLGEATRLRNMREFAAATHLLLPFVERHPEHGDAVRLLAQTLYWQGEPGRARTWYETALARFPADTAVRLDYARMLVETGDAGRAKELLIPLRKVPSLRGRPEALLGTLALWRGDLATARQLLTMALSADASQPEVTQRLNEIAILTAPWLRASATEHQDDQRLRRLGVEAAAGRHLGPGTEIGLQGSGSRFTSGDSIRQTVNTLEARLTNSFAANRLHSELAIGGLWRSGGGASDWTGRGSLGITVASHLLLRATAERAGYFYTLASIRSPVITSTLGGTLSWGSEAGWLGEIRGQVERYPDANRVRTTYGWFLAPVSRQRRATIHLGYSAAFQNSDANRFVLARPDQSVPMTSPAFDLSGQYRPYYTPNNLAAHSALAMLTVRPSGRSLLRLNGSVGVSAHDDAPSFQVIAGNGQRAPTLTRTFIRRSFTPLDITGEAGSDIARGVRLAVTLRVNRTAFYKASVAGIRLDFSLGAAARSRSVVH